MPNNESQPSEEPNITERLEQLFADADARETVFVTACQIWLDATKEPS